MKLTSFLHTLRTHVVAGIFLGFSSIASAQPCSPNADFTATNLGNCCWLFSDNTPSTPNAALPMCDFWEIKDAGGNVINSGNSASNDTYQYCFTTPGIYTVCNHDCCISSTGTFTFHDYCMTISVVACGTPCIPNAAFSITDLGNCCYQFDDLTPNPAPGYGCEHWTISFGGAPVANGNGSSYTVCFSTLGGSGTYQICFDDCCLNADGTMGTAQSCQTLTVDCGCTADANFTAADQGNCCYLFTDNTPDSIFGVVNCDYWEVTDAGGTVIATAYGDTFLYCFTLSGTYTICNTDCCINSDGTITWVTKCQTISVNCGCCVPYTFSHTETGCTTCITPLANCPLPSPNTVITVDYGDFSGITTSLCHTYAVSGTYNVCMTSCCLNSDGTVSSCVTHCKSVTVSCGEPCYPDPYFDFINWGLNSCCVDVVALTPNLCVDPSDPTSVSTDVNGDGVIDILDWQILLNNNCCSFDFGDGSGTVYGPGPHHHCYSTSGFYMICYTSCCIGTDGVLHTETICKDAYINCPPCDVDPTFTIQSLAAGNCCFLFTDNTPDGLFDVAGCDEWQIFDQNNILVTTGNGNSFSYCFTTNGTYTICNTDCCLNSDGTIHTETSCQTLPVTCFCTPDASFTLTDLGNCCFQVHGNSCPTIVTGVYPNQIDYECCTVDWGDGTAPVSGSGLQTHCYTGNGTYSICFTTCCVNPDGTITYATSCQPVTVNCCCLPVDWDYTLQNCEVCITPIYPAGCVAPTQNIWVEWGGTGTANGNLCFTYDVSGTYTICLYACCPSNTYPCDPVPICKTITVDCCCLPTDFTLTATGCAVDFDVLYNCPNAINNIVWTFGDGTTSTGPNPQHTFPGTGLFSVCMTACCCPTVNADGTVSQGNCITICHDVYVDCDCIDPTVIDPNIGCLAVYDPVCGCDGNTYSNSCVAYYQNGITSWTAGPCQGSCCLHPDQIIYETSNCCVNFGLIYFGCCFGPNTASFNWNFGDGGTSNIEYPSHCYSGSGTYTVTITTTCADGITQTLSTTVTVLCAVVGDPCDDVDPSFLFEVNGLNVHFFETGDIPVEDQFASRHWTFGDGSAPVMTENPVHDFPGSGTYSVTLSYETVDEGTNTPCSGSFSWNVAVESACPGDLDNNGFVNVGDLLLMIAAFGNSCQ